MKRLIFLIFMLIPVYSWGATIYVKDDPNNSGTKVCYKSGSWANATCSDGTGNTTLYASSVAAGSGGTLIIASGTYSGTQLYSSPQTFYIERDNQTIRAANGSDPLDGVISQSGTVTLNGNGASAHVVNVANPGLTFGPGIDITQPGSSYAGIFIRATGMTANDVNFSISNGHASSIGVDSNCSSACTSTFNSSTFTGGFRFIAASNNYNHTPTFNYSLFNGNASTAYNAAAIFNNCLFSGFLGSVMTTSGNSGVGCAGAACTSIWRNPIFYGNSLNSPTSHILNDSHDQTWTIYNGLLTSNPSDTDGYKFNNVVISDSIQNKDPLFVSPKYPSIVVLNIDDYTNFDWINDTIAPKILAKGWNGTFSISNTNNLTTGEKNKLLALQSYGHEISAHSRRHSDLTQTNTFTLQGAAGETVSNNGTTLTTSAGCGGGGCTYTLSSYETLTAFRSALVADGYTCGTINSALNISNLPPTYLANLSAQSIEAAHNLQLDTTRYWSGEVAGSISDLSTSGLTITTFIPPGNATSLSLRNYFEASTDLIGARGSSSANGTLSSLNIFDVPYKSLSTSLGTTTTCEAGGETRANCVKRNICSLLSKMSMQGYIYVFYTHGADEWSSADWDAMLDAIQESNVSVMTFSQAIAYAKSYDPSADLSCTTIGGDGEVCSRTLIDGSNYRIRSTSPAIDAGTAIAGLHTGSTIVDGDAGGNTRLYGSGVDIGGYEKLQKTASLFPALPVFGKPKYYTVP